MNGADTSLLEVNDFVTESQSQLLGLQLPRDISTRERPVEDGDGSSKHALHRFGRKALGIAAPLNGHGVMAADI